MTNYEHIKGMSIGTLALENIRHITFNIGYTPITIYITTDGFETQDKE